MTEKYEIKWKATQENRTQAQSSLTCRTLLSRKCINLETMLAFSSQNLSEITRLSCGDKKICQSIFMVYSHVT